VIPAASVIEKQLLHNTTLSEFKDKPADCLLLYSMTTFDVSCGHLPGKCFKQQKRTKLYN